MNDYVIGATAFNGAIRAFAAVTTNVVIEARRLHNLSPIASAALGRTLTAVAIMSTWLKNDSDSITMQVNGDGPLGRIIVVSDSKSNVKGYVENPNIETKINDLGKLDVSWGVGKIGYMNVIKDMGLKEPYIGFVDLVSGEIAEDLSYYFATSDQVPTVVSLGVLVDRDESILGSGGLIFQLMPDAEEEVISFLESKVANIPSVTKMISDGKSPEDILNFVFEGKDVSFSNKTPCNFICSCSDERMERNFLALGRKEIEDIIDEQGDAELICHFCNAKYYFSKDKLLQMLAEND